MRCGWSTSSTADMAVRYGLVWSGPLMDRALDAARESLCAIITTGRPVRHARRGPKRDFMELSDRRDVKVITHTTELRRVRERAKLVHNLRICACRRSYTSYIELPRLGWFFRNLEL